MFAFLEGNELLVVLLIVLVVFGGSKLPQLAKALGQSKKAFKDGMDEADRDDRLETVVFNGMVNTIDPATKPADLTKNEDPKQIEQDLIGIIPEDKWIQFSHQLIWHGRRVCIARKPRCADCNLESICYSKDKTI